MKNANKCPKNPKFHNGEKMIKWSDIHRRSRSPPNVNHF